jgi:hypothetical protein
MHAHDADLTTSNDLLKQLSKPISRHSVTILKNITEVLLDIAGGLVNILWLAS